MSSLSFHGKNKSIQRAQVSGKATVIPIPQLNVFAKNDDAKSTVHYLELHGLGDKGDKRTKLVGMNMCVFREYLQH